MRCVFLFLLALWLPCVRAQSPTRPVNVCANQAEMPPFTYIERTAGPTGGAVTGVTIDMLKRIAQPNGWKLSIQLMPWLRCLAFVAEGKFQFALNVEQGEAGKLLLSRSYFTVHSMYFYSSRVHPNGLHLTRIADIQRYKLCGLLGHRFESIGIDTAKVDLGTTSHEQLIGKLHRGRCDLFIENRETLAGLYLLNPKFLAMLTDPTPHSEVLPESPARDLHIAVAPGAQDLLRKLDDGLAALQASKEIDKLLGNYLK